MDRNGNVVAESMVVQHVDAEEQYDVDDPTPNRDFVWRQE